ncbi:uncharacterized protein isoform X2 [Musca autumnalis]|uniref:uncharacterized protein isoform X2 n=1 Tax=Musca autumnalis TaxID=221902 RepID=UPI003CED2058
MFSIKTEPFANDHKQEDSTNDTNTTNYNTTKHENFTNMENYIKEDQVVLDKIQNFLPENVAKSTIDIIKEEDMDEFLPKNCPSKDDMDEMDEFLPYATSATTQQISLPKLEIIDVHTDEDDSKRHEINEKGRIVQKNLLKMNNIEEINSQELLEIDGNIVVVRDTSHCRSQDAEYNEDDYMLREFLKGINMELLFEQLKASDVTFRSLQYLKKEDLKEAVPPLGLRVEFREKLFAWKKRELGIDDETMSVPSKIGEWWKRNETPASTPGTPHTTVSYGSKAKGILSEDLKELLTHTSKGKLALECSSANKKLSDEQRDDIINIIIEDILTNNVTLYAQDFMRILDEICSVFPLENEMRDYYYISRKRKNNASGKLYAKYRNKKSKKIKLLDSEPSTSKAAAHTSSNLCNNNVPEFDESVENSMKASLLRECNDWGSICEKWKRSFNIRQRDIKSLSSHAFLLEWPKLSDARASELVNIDFDIMYPQKGNLLHSKWDQFKKKVYNYYGKNVHNEHCKQLFVNVLTASSIDAQDYIYAILLNSVLPSPARFKCGNGKLRKKVTIADSQESFVLRLPTINDYKRQIDAVTEKYYNAGLTIQPFIIVEGLSDFNIKGFYVFFNHNLLKFQSFLECLDTCFKIFHALSLKYPNACQIPWIFIQKYFYEINTVFDIKSVNLTSLINFCNNS